MNMARICKALVLVAAFGLAPHAFGQSARPAPETRSPQQIQQQQRYDRCRQMCRNGYATCGDQAVRDGRGQAGVNDCVPAYNACNRRCEGVLSGK